MINTSPPIAAAKLLVDSRTNCQNIERINPRRNNPETKIASDSIKKNTPTNPRLNASIPVIIEIHGSFII